MQPSDSTQAGHIEGIHHRGIERALLQSDPTAPSARVVSGIPLVTSPAVGNDIVWAIPKSRVIVALRQGTTVEPDRSVFFTSDRTAVRAIVRVSWGFVDPASITKIATTP